jgi:hypothetical protein
LQTIENKETQGLKPNIFLLNWRHDSSRALTLLALSVEFCKWLILTNFDCLLSPNLGQTPKAGAMLRPWLLVRVVGLALDVELLRMQRRIALDEDIFSD